MILFTPYFVWFAGVINSQPISTSTSMLIAIPVASGLIYVNRQRIARSRGPRPSWAIPVLILAHAVNLTGVFCKIPTLSGIALPLAVVAVVAFYLGAGAAGEMAIPAFFLIFTLPIEALFHARLDPVLQQLSAIFAQVLMTTTGVQVVGAGTVIATPFYYVTVDDVCSGFQTLLALLMYGAAFAQLLAGNTWRRLTLTLSAVPLGLAANGVRIAFILFMGHVWGKDVADGPLHNLSGVVLFLGAFLVLYIEATILRKRWPRETMTVPASTTLARIQP